MILNKKKVEKLAHSWCYLDNMFGYLDEMIRKNKDNKALCKLLTKEQTDIDNIRTTIMQIWGFEDYDYFVKMVISGYADWDKNLNRWYLSSRRYLVK